MKYFKYVIIFFFIYLFLAVPFLNRPLVVDEVDFVQFARVPWSFADLGTGAHPPFYIDTLRFLSQVFDVSGANLRIVGIICFLLNLILIYKLSHEIFKDRKRGVLASLIFALHPLAIQGSMVLDIDNTVLTVFLTFACLYYARNIDNFSLRKGIFLILLLFSSLWAKLGTPFIFMGSLILFHILKGQGKRASQIFFVSIAATLLFLLVWKIDSVIFGFPFSVAFQRGVSVITKGLQFSLLPVVKQITLRALRVTLWLGLYFVLLWTVSCFKHVKDIMVKRLKLDFNFFLIIYSASIFLFYLLIGGTMFGFAKYQYPLLPILSIIIANAVLSLDLNIFKKNIIIYLCFGAAFAIISYIFSGDLLYQINYNLRQIAIFSPQELPDFYRDFARRIILYFIPFVFGIFVIKLSIRKESWLRIFSFLAITFIILGNFSSDIYLRGTQFFTSYCYGRDIGEFKRVSNLCKDIIKKDKNATIIAPKDVLENAGVEVFIGYHKLWNDKDKFLEIVKDRRVKAVIYTFSYNALYSYKEIFLDADVEKILKKHYSLLVIDTHDVWLRK